MTSLADVAARLSALLHTAGLPVSPDRAGQFAAAVDLAPPALVSELYWLARVTLVTEQSQIAVFDAVFSSVFEGFVDPADFRGDAPSSPSITRRRDTRPTPVNGLAPSGHLPTPLCTTAGATAEDELSPDGRESVLAAMSPDERLRHQDFSTLTPAELALVASLRLTPPPRHSRRRERRRAGRELDVRATLRRARRSGGEPFSQVRRRRRLRPRRLVLICDISGSMESYTRAYLQLLWSGVRTTRAEAFVFATRLTRLTKAMAGATPDVALERAGRLAPDWSGGTRIGQAIKDFNDGYGRRGLARGAVVLVLSDGWDTGDPDVLAQELERLGRLAFRIVWVNPRRAAPGYQPLVGGMTAALPFVDSFVSGNSPAALHEVIEAVEAPD